LQCRLVLRCRLAPPLAPLLTLVCTGIWRFSDVTPDSVSFMVAGGGPVGNGHGSSGSFGVPWQRQLSLMSRTIEKSRTTLRAGLPRYITAYMLYNASKALNAPGVVAQHATEVQG
jgi:hypothetical protein